MTDKQKIQTFLYLLSRDSLPWGEITKLILTLEEIKNGGILFPELTNKDLECASLNWAERILK